VSAATDYLHTLRDHLAAGQPVGPAIRFKGDTMQKKILGSILVLLLAVPGVSLAFAGGDKHGDGDDVRTFKVTLRHGPDTDHELDLGASGLSVGDRFFFAADAFRNDERVGVGAGDCVTVRFRPGAEQRQRPAVQRAGRDVGDLRGFESQNSCIMAGLQYEERRLGAS
jgi:hypothetical protein